MKNARIALFGLNFKSGNLGCAALAYSFLNILIGLTEKMDCKFDITFYDSVKSSLSGLPELNSDRVHISTFSYDKHNIKALYKKIKNEDIVFDFTAGDSFADYYGLSRFVKRTFNKTLVVFSKKTLILGPQTYGPFKSPISKVWAGYIIRKAGNVYARDEQSLLRARKVSRRKDIGLVTDVAFALPYNKDRFSCLVDDSKINVGLNFSGLLYTGGYTQNNQFGLTVDYKEYCMSILQYFEKNKDKYSVWLVPHAVSKREGFPDNDMIPTNELAKQFPFVKVAPAFSSPMDAKSFISNMDIFSGARMHATIAAFSSSVVTIPFSYSVKFEGLYGELNYPYCIHGKEYSTEQAVNKTIEYINDFEFIKKKQGNSLQSAQEKLARFVADVENILQKL